MKPQKQTKEESLIRQRVAFAGELQLHLAEEDHATLNSVLDWVKTRRTPGKSANACPAAYLYRLLKEHGLPDSAGSRQGNIDFLLRPLLRQSRIHSIESVPYWVSSVGTLVDSAAVLASAEIRENYKKLEDPTFKATLWYDVNVCGYKPHIEQIRMFPRSYYEHPRYLAPVEDLLMHLANTHFINRIPSDADRGAVGWVIDLVTSSRTSQDHPDLLRILSSDIGYWTIEELLECKAVWENVVRTALDKTNTSKCNP
jgi:hypothetical protein